MKQITIAGNWKMNKTFSEAELFFFSLNEFLKKFSARSKILLCPSFPYLDLALQSFSTAVEIASQDVSAHSHGAYTGEVSAKMISSLGIKSTLLGHSERREYHGESNQILKSKLGLCIHENLSPIYCVGETIEQRKAGKHFETITSQIIEALEGFSSKNLADMSIAYEPVWAIGTGEVASPEQAEEMHLHIRAQIKNLFGEDFANKLSILYGGSVKPSNAKVLFSQPNVDGGLIGGASLEVEDFIKIIKQTETLY